MNPEGSPLPAQPQQPTPSPQTPQAPETISSPAPAPGPPPLKQIRTFQGDVAEAISRQNESVASIQQAEVAKRDAMRVLGPKDADTREGSRTKALAYTLLSFVLVAAGAAGAWYSYDTFKEKTAPPVTSTPANQFVGAGSIVYIDASTLSRQALLGVLSGEREKAREVSAIEHIQLRRGTGETAELLTTSDFLVRLDSHAPDTLVRALEEPFMLGALGGEQSQMFVLIPIDSFENAFPGMLAWEPRLAEDVLPLFAHDAVVQSVPSSASFVDVTIGNRDTRVLKDQAGNTVFLYAFFDNALLIMTTNEDAFRTIINRLQSEKLSR